MPQSRVCHLTHLPGLVPACCERGTLPVELAVNHTPRARRIQMSAHCGQTLVELRQRRTAPPVVHRDIATGGTRRTLMRHRFYSTLERDRCQAQSGHALRRAGPKCQVVFVVQGYYIAASMSAFFWLYSSSVMRPASIIDFSFVSFAIGSSASTGAAAAAAGAVPTITWPALALSSSIFR